MARSPLDNISSRAALEGMTPQNGLETQKSEMATKPLSPHIVPQPGEKLHARPMPASAPKGVFAAAMQHLIRDHDKA
jgi:hypothetical protein